MIFFFFFFFFNDTATTEIYTLSLHDALPISCGALPGAAAPEPAWTAGQLAAVGIAAEPGPVREGTGLGLASAGITPALLGEAPAGAPGRRPPENTLRLAMPGGLGRGRVPRPAAGKPRPHAQAPP